MSRKSLIVVATAAVLLMFTAALNAQDAPTRFQVYGGYSFLRFNPPGNGANFHGWGAAFQADIGNSPFSVVADFSGNYRQQSHVDNSIHNFLFGPRVTKRSGNYAVFGHGLFGGSRASAGAFGITVAETKFAAALGGGLDISGGNKHVSFRAFQLDYLMTRFGNQTQNNVRIGVGAVFKF